MFDPPEKAKTFDSNQFSIQNAQLVKPWMHIDKRILGNCFHVETVPYDQVVLCPKLDFPGDTSKINLWSPGILVGSNKSPGHVKPDSLFAANLG